MIQFPRPCVGSTRALLAALCLVASSLSGCTTRGGAISYDSKSFVAPDKPVSLQALDHRIAPGDVLTVTVYQVDNLSGDRTVDEAGRIGMPLIGTIDVTGKTTDELRELIAGRLSEKYLRAPQVTVSLKTIAQDTVTVDGAVTQPGLYSIQPNTTLIQAIALARGPSQGANEKRVVVFRQINGQRQAAAFDLNTIRHGKDADPRIYGDDVIVVDGSGVKSAFRTVIQSIPLLTIFRPF